MSERISDLGGEPSDLDLGLEGGGELAEQAQLPSLNPRLYVEHTFH